MTDPKKLTRKELAQFLPSDRAIRAFEKLFDLIPFDLESLQNQINEILIALGVIDSELDTKATMKQTIVDVGSTYVLDAFVNVIDADISESSLVTASIAPVAIDYTRPYEEVIYERFIVSCFPKNGSIDFYLQPERGHFNGQFVINYMVRK